MQQFLKFITRRLFSTPDDGCVTPETCRVTWQCINVCILLYRVGPLLTLNVKLGCQNVKLRFIIGQGNSWSVGPHIFIKKDRLV